MSTSCNSHDQHNMFSKVGMLLLLFRGCICRLFWQEEAVGQKLVLYIFTTVNKQEFLLKMHTRVLFYLDGFQRYEFYVILLGSTILRITLLCYSVSLTPSACQRVHLSPCLYP